MWQYNKEKREEMIAEKLQRLHPLEQICSRSDGKKRYANFLERWSTECWAISIPLLAAFSDIVLAQIS